MQDFTTPTDELGAVNHILQNMNEAPIDTLEGDIPLDAAMARDKVRFITETVLAHGWFWNTEYRVLQRSNDGRIPAPSNAIAVEPHGRYGYSLTIRDGWLYRISPFNSGFEFPGDEAVKVTLLLSFADLPAIARLFVARRSAREFQVQHLGDNTITQQDLDEEARAWATMVADDNRASQRSLKNSPQLQMILGRNRRRH